MPMQLFAIHMAGTYVAVGAISVGMAIQMGSCCDHLQHSIRAVLDMAPDIIKVKAPCPCPCPCPCVHVHVYSPRAYVVVCVHT